MRPSRVCSQLGSQPHDHTTGLPLRCQAPCCPGEGHTPAERCCRCCCEDPILTNTHEPFPTPQAPGQRQVPSDGPGVRGGPHWRHHDRRPLRRQRAGAQTSCLNHSDESGPILSLSVTNTSVSLIRASLCCRLHLRHHDRRAVCCRKTGGAPSPSDSAATLRLGTALPHSNWAWSALQSSKVRQSA